MVATLLGTWQLQTHILCEGAALGRTFRASIAGLDTEVMFPTREGLSLDESFDNLKSPQELFGFQKRIWGYMRDSGKDLCEIETLVLRFPQVELETAAAIFEAFPTWKRKFEKLMLIATGEFAYPSQPPRVLLGGEGDPYNGLTLYSTVKDQTPEVIKTRITHNMSLNLLNGSECLDVAHLQQLFLDTSSSAEISTAYELLQDAYQLLLDGNNRSAVITAGTAVEVAATRKARQHFNANKEDEFERQCDDHRGIGGKLIWLKELGMEDSAMDYKDAITVPRNKASHEGIVPDLKTAKACLAACRAVIQKCCSNVLEE